MSGDTEQTERSAVAGGISHGNGELECTAMVGMGWTGCNGV